MLAGVSEPNSGKADGSGSEVSLSESSSSSSSGDETSAEVATSSDSSSAVVGTSAVGSAELEAGVSVAVSPPPQAATTRANDSNAASNHICDPRFMIFLFYCKNLPCGFTFCKLAFLSCPVIVASAWPLVITTASKHRH